VEQGNGGFTLTPQLRADIQVESAEAVATGVVTAHDPEAQTFELEVFEGAVSVVYTAGTEVWFDGDEDTPSGTLDDLTDGLDVAVYGVLDLDGVLTAERIIIYPAM